ncbi:hypothetical protein CYMTET_22148, partial [Cymbomonas tetramitiformis]
MGGAASTHTKPRKESRNTHPDIKSSSNKSGVVEPEKSVSPERSSKRKIFTHHQTSGSEDGFNAPEFAEQDPLGDDRATSKTTGSVLNSALAPIGFEPKDADNYQPRSMRASIPKNLSMTPEEVPVANVTLHWMRHAFSCANLLEACGARWDGLVSIRSALTPDPQLTNIGVEQAKRAGQVLRDTPGLRPDIVLCSGLTRAVETALFAFGPLSPYGGSVFPVPCISEKRGPLPSLRDSLPAFVLHDDDNKMLETRSLQEKFMGLFEEEEDGQLGILAAGINWRYIEDKGGFSLQQPPSIDKFCEQVLPVVVADVLKERLKKDKKRMQ